MKIRVELEDAEWAYIEDLLRYGITQKGNSKSRNDTPYMDKIVDVTAQIIFQINREKIRAHKVNPFA